MRNIKLFILLFFTVLTIGCDKNEDDINVSCIADCTTIQGKFVTLNNEPVSNVKVTLEYYISGMSGAKIRKIVDVNSDSKGNYYKTFHVKDSELGIDAPGYFLFKIDDSRLDVNQYIRTNNLIGETTNRISSIFPLTKRDTIIDQTFYIPKKAHVKINLKNFVPQKSNDYFQIQTLYPYGVKIGENPLLDTAYNTGFSGFEEYKATNQDTHLNVYVAEGEKNIIRVYRRKNGVESHEDFPFYIPQHNNIELTYYY